MDRNDPRWRVGEERMTDRFYDTEHRYIVRMLAEPWRKRGLAETAVCRCEQATPCFDHTVYLADLRTLATEMLDRKEVSKASKMFSEATALYLQLTK